MPIQKTKNTFYNIYKCLKEITIIIYFGLWLYLYILQSSYKKYSKCGIYNPRIAETTPKAYNLTYNDNTLDWVWGKKYLNNESITLQLYKLLPNPTIKHTTANTCNWTPKISQDVFEKK